MGVGALLRRDVLSQSEGVRVPALEELAKQLNAYANQAQVGRPEFAQLFAESIRTLEAPDDEVAVRLQVSRPTVGRWARGETVPHGIARNAVLRELSRWSAEKQKSYNRR
jgi:hypothetical protein